MFAGDEAFPYGLSGREPNQAPPRAAGWIHVIEWDDWENPEEVARYRVPEAGTHNLWIEDDVLYVAYYNGGVRLVDISGELRGDLYRQGREIAMWLLMDSSPRALARPIDIGSAAYLHPGQVFWSTEPALVSTILGSCVAVCLWDPTLRIGGMNHYLLPHRVGNGDSSPRYGNEAVRQLIVELERCGSSTDALRAKVFGGANVLRAPGRGSEHLGAKNVEIARSLLAEAGIRVEAEDVGGKRGRKVFFQTNGLSGVDHIGRSHSQMYKTGVFTDVFAHTGHKSDEIVVSDLFNLIDAFDSEIGFAADGFCRPFIGNVDFGRLYFIRGNSDFRDRAGLF